MVLEGICPKTDHLTGRTYPGSKNGVILRKRGSPGFRRGSRRLQGFQQLAINSWLRQKASVLADGSNRCTKNNIQDTAVGYEFTGQETESLSWTNRVESNGKRVEHGFSSFPLFDFAMMQNSTLQVTLSSSFPNPTYLTLS